MKENTRRIPPVRLIVISAIIILFFLGVITVYYFMMYSATSQNLIKSSEFTAINSAEKIDSYLSTGINSIRIVSYSIDNMIRDGKSQSDIEEYLVNQSDAMSHITSGSINGFYGLIGGEYLDGSHWVPDPDYVPAERPWYIEAKASIGRVAVVPPYVDEMTNTVMVSLSKTLCDTKSVVAVDFPVDYIQSVAEEINAENSANTELIVDEKYRVIAHSDFSKVGKTYLPGNDSFENALVKAIGEADSDYFSMTYDGTEYMIYTASVANDWLCISIFDTTDSYDRIRFILLFTVLTGLAIVLILSVIMYYANRKRLMADALLEDLSDARNDIMDKEEKIGEIQKVAYHDALTGVGSKAAFDHLAAELSESIRSHDTGIAVVMMDVNNLKYVNDTFGHDKGDAYLCGCCKIVCNIYKHSPVFRLGGDEFTVVLKGSDYENRYALLEKLNHTFEESFAQSDAQPWECYSLVGGMSELRLSDTSLEQILKRADQEMYKAKQIFKSKNGSYR